MQCSPVTGRDKSSLRPAEEDRTVEDVGSARDNGDRVGQPQ